MAAFQSVLIRSLSVMEVILFSFKKYKNRLLAVSLRHHYQLWYGRCGSP
jgi:uncharacterized protein (DUF3820 family)